MRSVLFVCGLCRSTRKQVAWISSRGKRTALAEHSLTNRMMNFLHRESAKQQQAQNESSNLERKFLAITKLPSVENRWEFQKILSRLDAECSLHLEALDTRCIFRLLLLLLQTTPNRIVEQKFYQTAMERLSDDLDVLTDKQVVSFIFYLGLYKKNVSAQEMFKKAFRRVQPDCLSVEQTCIVCNAAFKLSLKITNKRFLDRVLQTLNGNLYLLKDPALFVTLIKTVRHSRYQNEDVLSTISCAVLFNSTVHLYTFPAICHILALYADYLYYDEDMLRVFVQKGVEQLRDMEIKPKRTYMTEQIRPKDIKRFLWALSNLAYEMDGKKLKEIVVPAVLERARFGEFRKEPDVLLDIILYLWILNYKAVDLMAYAFTEDNISYIKQIPTRTKQRLNVLLSFVQLEDNKLYRQINIKPVYTPRLDAQVESRKRPALQRVFEVLQNVSPRLDLRFKYTYEVPHLNIVGITGFRSNTYKSVFVEVLDDYVSLKNKPATPFGPMQVKLRILEAAEEALITVHAVELDELSELELQKHLEDELRLLS